MFYLNEDSNTPSYANEVLRNLVAGTYYLQTMVYGRTDYNFLGIEDLTDVISVKRFSILSGNNYWVERLNITSWQQGNFNSTIFGIAAYREVTLYIHDEERNIILDFSVDNIENLLDKHLQIAYIDTDRSIQILEGLINEDNETISFLTKHLSKYCLVWEEEADSNTNIDLIIDSI